MIYVIENEGNTLYLPVIGPDNVSCTFAAMKYAEVQEMEIRGCVEGFNVLVVEDTE